MGLMLSLLVTCVGVLEALACWRHFRVGYLPLPVSSCADGDAKYAAGSSSSSSDDSGSVRSLGAYYCSDESVSKYGLTPMLSEHRRKQPNHRNGDADAEDAGGSGGSGGGCGREGHCGDVSGCAELVLDTLPTIQELAQEPEEEQEGLPTEYGKDSDNFTGLQLHESHFSFEAAACAAENASELGVAGNSDQRRDILDENENISESWSVGERTSHEGNVVHTCTKPRPPQLHYKAPTGDEDIEPQEFRTIRSPPKGTVDRVFTVEEIRGGVNETNTNASVGIFPSADTRSDVTKTSVSVCEELSEVGTYVESSSPHVKDADRRNEPEGSESREEEREPESETQRMSRASQAWAEADALFQKRSPSRSPHRSPQRSPPKKLPKNVDISWPSFTPQPLFRRASGTQSTAPANLWPPAADKRRASSGDVSSDLPDASEGKPFRSSSVGPKTRRRTEPSEAGDDCSDPWTCDLAWEREEKKGSTENADPLTREDTQVTGSSEKQSDGPLGRGTKENGLQILEQDIPCVNTSTKSCHSITEPKLIESMLTSKTKSHSLVTEKDGKKSTTSFDQTAPQNSLGVQQCDADDQNGPPAHTVHTAEEELEVTSEDKSATEEAYTGELGDKSFAVEKSEPRKKHKRSVRISSFEKEDMEKAQQKSRRSKATEQCSDEESDDRSAASQGDCSSSSQPPGAGEPFWLIFSGEYTKAMSKDWHSGHFSCWQCDESLTGQRYVLRDDHPYCIKCYESVFANVCEECNKIIGIDSKDLSYKEKHWHEACFLCNKCRVSLVDKQFGSKGEKIYCGNCYDSQFASRCDGCGEIFRAGTKKMEYKTRQWHEKCFCCCVCKTPIGTKSFIPREQEIYCATCYEEKFATRCVKCNKIITSGGVTYKNEPWHRECFTCTNCNTSLAGQRFTSRDEKPYCADCFGELFAKRCTACSKPITGIGGTRFISFEDRHWHNDCFICAMCKTSLVGRGFITDADDIICPDCAKQKLM